MVKSHFRLIILSGILVSLSVILAFSLITFSAPDIDVSDYGEEGIAQLSPGREEPEREYCDGLELPGKGRLQCNSTPCPNEMKGMERKFFCPDKERPHCCPVEGELCRGARGVCTATPCPGEEIVKQNDCWSNDAPYCCPRVGEQCRRRGSECMKHPCPQGAIQFGVGGCNDPQNPDPKKRIEGRVCCLTSGDPDEPSRSVTCDDLGGSWIPKNHCVVSFNGTSISLPIIKIPDSGGLFIPKNPPGTEGQVCCPKWLGASCKKEGKGECMPLHVCLKMRGPGGKGSIVAGRYDCSVPFPAPGTKLPPNFKPPRTIIDDTICCAGLEDQPPGYQPPGDQSRLQGQSRPAPPFNNFFIRVLDLFR